ncbi:uncharacterized protein FOMMEDRAFT_158502 [Fomitiporia mediterranea MF3/22]|uniref:uncharacterized protein n=1 Tax=Fomitiporia mediterranea (strain MF3/22) TaxID=694068 RepID=UPI0004408725|nr:uncharacterized protein FOMMEDRAFT_158502 [Fomitiporia mediterranea MF3/22]EJD01366.1 hypothetical protein FOMMEDRAFT_158502 [Fomitiporia mediterranea MF3/22]
MSQRPSSAVPPRPSSSLSRPSSVASHRTASRVSNRPLSRLSQRSSTRQTRALIQTLVSQVTGLTPDVDDEFDEAYDTAIRRIDSLAKHAVSPDLQTALRRLRGFSKKARIQSNDELADAFDIVERKLQEEIQKKSDLDNEISTAKLSDHLQLLYLLASPPSSSTNEFAARLVDGVQSPSAPATLTWADILKEEPFEGQHWQGAYGLPPGSIAEQWEEGSTDSSPLLSPVNDSELDEREDLFSTLEYDNSTDASERVLTPPLDGNTRPTTQDRLVESLRLRLELDALQKQQFWKKSWRTDAQLDREFDLGEPSTLGPSFHRATDKSHYVKPENERYINEHDAVREVLISLQGRTSILFEQEVNKDGVPSMKVSRDVPKLLHLTPSAQQSILSKFALLATTLNRLRIFLAAVVHDVVDASSKNSSRTLEAFAEALELQVISFEACMARKEETMLRAHTQTGRSTVVSLLSLEKDVRHEFSDSFDELLGIIDSIFLDTAWLSRDRILSRVKLSPSSFTSRLLDSLFDSIQRKESFGDTTSATLLMQVFCRTAEPVWKMLGDWLHNGIFMPEVSDSISAQDTVPQEFFIESNGLDLMDIDFWDYGYSLRFCSSDEDTSSDLTSVPIFLRPLANKVLSAGKSIGLLRILGHSPSLNEQGKLSAREWTSFGAFMLKLVRGEHLFVASEADIHTTNITADNVSLSLSDYLLPICADAEKTLKDLLYTECDLLRHLHTTEDLFLSRKGDIIADFCDALFTAIDAKKIWTDYHFLNTAFREAVSSRYSHQIDSSLVRLSYKSSSKVALLRSVKCFDGLTVDYAAPFPLAFVISSNASRVYNAVFVLLIKIRRAKTFLDNILLRISAADTTRSRDELKTFYVTRSKLSWFVNIFLDFVCSYVLHVEIQRLHASLQGADSLDDIIGLHQKHLSTIERLCFLDDKTSSLQRALISIFDMCISFSDCFVAFAGDTTLNTSRLSMSRPNRHRSRRQRRAKLDIVSHEPISSFRDEESESSDSDLDESLILQEIMGDASPSSAAAPATYESFYAGEEDFFDHNEKILKDLDSLVRYMRREVEKLALTSNGHQFGVLAFSLQDWDL